MKMLLLCATLLLSACSKWQSAPLPEGTDNIPPSPNWERIATLANTPGVYKVVDMEDGVICYYIYNGGQRYNNGVNGISCMPVHIPTPGESQ